MSKFPIKYTPHPVCPFCGYVFKDAWEMDFGPGGDGEIATNCHKCGSEVIIEREISVTYSTTKGITHEED